MSTIHHPAHLHLWWYATAAAFAGAVLFLAFLTLRPDGAAPSVGQEDGVGTVTQTYRHFRVPACLAGHPVADIELAVPGCAGAR